MPSKVDKMRIPRNLNRTVKLSLEQREEIRWKYKNTITSQRKLAEEYNVSKRTIQFVLNPDKYEIAKAQRRQRWAEGKYRIEKSEHATNVRNTRHYKVQLDKTGLLLNKKEEQEC